MTSLSSGAVAPGFESVVELFDRFLAEDPDYSAQLAVYHRGTKVVDVVGGPDMAADSLTGLYSCSKGVSALVLALLVQDGLLDLDAPVIRYWPEFGAAGKEAVTVRQLLSHQAGLLGVEGGFSTEEYHRSELAAARLALARPNWQPGRAFSYHALTIGVFMEELCRRITGSTLQQVYEERLRAPLGADFYLGLPEALEPRYRDVLWSADPAEPWLDPASLAGLAVNAGHGSILDLPNIREVRAAGMAAAGGVGTAEGLARLYAAAVTGVENSSPLLTEDTVARMSEEQVYGLDRASGLTGAFGVVFMRPIERKPFGSYRAFGHDGANGSLGLADPVYGIGFGYVPQRVEDGAARSHALTAAVRRAVLANY